jgi:hypothetical protein
MAILAMISTAFENAISESFHIQSLEATEMGGTSMCRGKRESTSGFPNGEGEEESVGMPGLREKKDSTSVDLAMNQVLAAEREARAAVEACREDARRILEDASSRSRRISRRADRRVQATQRIADAAVERAVGELSSSEPGRESGQAAETDDERLTQAVERLVEEIVGAER